MDDQRRNFKLITYGERPITELFITSATGEDIYSLINEIRLADGNKIEVDKDVEKIELIIVEAPLGKAYGCADFVVFTTHFGYFFEVKPASYDDVFFRLDDQLPRYYRFINAKKTWSRSDLVCKIHNIMRSKSRNYLVCITRDHDFKNQRGLFDCIKGVDTSIVGWAPYSVIMGALKKKGFRFMNPSSQIWTEE